MNLTLPDVVTPTVNVYGPGRLVKGSCGNSQQKNTGSLMMRCTTEHISRPTGKDCFEKES
jgi:hypothetical protein